MFGYSTTPFRKGYISEWDGNKVDQVFWKVFGARGRGNKTTIRRERETKEKGVPSQMHISKNTQPKTVQRSCTMEEGDSWYYEK